MSLNTKMRAHQLNVVAVDPGVHACALACVQGGHLVALGEARCRPGVVGPNVLVSLAAELARVWSAGVRPGMVWTNFWTLVVEGQQSYGDATNKARRSDVVDLSMAAAVVVVTASQAMNPPTEILLPLPGRWKGQRKKEAHHLQAADVLDPYEAAILVGKDHNYWDAATLALWAVGRIY